MSELRGKAAINKMQQLRFEELMPRLEGALAVFRERPLITIVRVSQISSDDNGMNCVLTNVSNPGLRSLPTRNPEGVSIGASWDIFNGDEHHWHASLVSWDLFFEQEALEEVLALGREEAQRGATLDFERGRVVGHHVYLRQSNRLRL